MLGWDGRCSRGVGVIVGSRGIEGDGGVPVEDWESWKIREKVRVLWGWMGTRVPMGLTRRIGLVRLAWKLLRKTRVVGDNKEDWG